MKLKQILLQRCKEAVQKQLDNLQTTINANQQSLHSETKSSAGDKHETGRAMLQLEMEKAGKQYLEVQKMMNLLSMIDSLKPSNKIHLGSVIFTDKANYYLSVSIGKIQVDDTLFYAISPSSPIGKLLLGKHPNDRITFNGKTIAIRKII